MIELQEHDVVRVKIAHFTRLAEVSKPNVDGSGRLVEIDRSTDDMFGGYSHYVIERGQVLNVYREVTA